MPVIIPENLPATRALQREYIPVMHERRALTQDIRPLKIALVNLMPKKIETEIQFLRLIGNTPLQVEVDLIAPATHESKNTSRQHLLDFYKTIDQIEGKRYDGCVFDHFYLLGSAGGSVLLLQYSQGGSAGKTLWGVFA